MSSGPFSPLSVSFFFFPSLNAIGREEKKKNSRIHLGKEGGHNDSRFFCEAELLFYFAWRNDAISLALFFSLSDNVFEEQVAELF